MWKSSQGSFVLQKWTITLKLSKRYINLLSKFFYRFVGRLLQQLEFGTSMRRVITHRKRCVPLWHIFRSPPFNGYRPWSRGIMHLEVSVRLSVRFHSHAWTIWPRAFNSLFVTILPSFEVKIKGGGQGQRLCSRSKVKRNSQYLGLGSPRREGDLKVHMSLLIFTRDIGQFH